MVEKRKPGELKPSCTDDIYEIRWKDLPLSCPMPDMKLWNAHPRVYLSIHRTGKAMCEYCGARYVLKDPEQDEPMPRFDNIELENKFRRAQQRVRANGTGKTSTE